MITSLDRELLRHVTGPAPLGGEPALRYAGRRSIGQGGAFAAVMVDLARRVWRAVRVAREARATARALAVLDNRALSDVGVSRGAIPAVAQQAASAHLAVAGLA